MEKRVIVDQIEITNEGHTQVRMCKQVIDAGNVLASEYHRTSVVVGGSVDDQFRAVNDHLASMGWPAVSADEISHIAKLAAVAATPEKVASYQAKQH